MEAAHISSEELGHGDVKNSMDGDLNMTRYMTPLAIAVKHLYRADPDVGEAK